MNLAVRNHGGELGRDVGTADILAEQFANAVDRYEQSKYDACDPALHLSFAYGSLTAIAAMAIGALERAEEASHDPLDALRREDAAHEYH